MLHRDWSAALAAGCLSCVAPPLTVTPLPPLPPACPIEGCAGRVVAPSSSSPASACPSVEAPCEGSLASECTQRALVEWSEARDDRAVACPAQRLNEACSLGDAHACAYAGRMRIDGRGQPRDPNGGIALVLRACEGGVLISCVFGTRWLNEPLHAREVPDAGALRARFEVHQACLNGEAEACYRMGLLSYFGRGAFARDRGRAASAYARGCDLGDSRACNNLGDALAYGEGTERDVSRAAALFDKACLLGEALGCANLGYMAEHGRGVAKDRGRARSLYREACASGDVYGCLHETMLAAEDAGAPRDPELALRHWRIACERRDARACAFVGVMYEDGLDGVARDDALSLRAMSRGCELGDARACEWVKAHSGE
ncbi:MAG: sel1 repeat family protein [Myxococcota bacterium]|nr:sel1 repeat family protein [Myxococcota bacterium]